MVPQQYCLRWKHHHTNVQNMFAQLLEKERFCDVTLYCSPNFAAAHQDDSENIRGVSLRAHRVVLASCSELLGALLAAHEPLGEPVLVIDGAEPRHLRALLDYMYTGEMNVHHSQLASLLKTAEELRIKGLTDIRWNNKNELPDCQSGAVTTTSLKKHSSPEQRRHLDLQEVDPRYQLPFDREDGRHKYSDEDGREKTNVNGGPPPLIKLPLRTDKTSPLKREHSDNDSASPKRRRIQSGTENTDDEDRDPLEWQHGNLDISAERVVSWPRATEDPGERSDGSDGSDEWADAPADIGSFLHTRLRVDGDNSADEESNEGAPPSTSSSAGASAVDLKLDHLKIASKLTIGPKSGPTDPRFTDVVKLNDYLKNGRRPQFWEEHYVKKVMEAVRVKELEMKQAAEILGVSYGTLYGRYRDVFGCINRPYRTARDFWQAKGPAEVLERLQRGEMSFDAGAVALGVSANNLAAYMADLNTSHYPVEKDFEPIPIEVDPSLKKTMVSGTANTAAGIVKVIRNTYGSDKSKKPNVSVTMSCPGEDDIPASVITTQDHAAGNKWPSIRVANIESLREGGVPGAPPAAGPPASPTVLMRTRPDLTIVAARKPDRRDDT